MPVKNIPASNSSSSSSNNSSESGSSYRASKGDHVWLNNASSDEIYRDPSHNDSRGTGHQVGVGSGDELLADGYENGFMRIKNSSGEFLGWVENDKLNKWNDAQGFATGGRISFNETNEKLAFVGDGEKVLKPEDNIMLDEIYNHVKVTDDMINKQIAYMGSIGGYNLPTQLSDSSLNRIMNNNNLTNNNSNSKYEINNKFDIVNKHQVNADKMPKDIIKLFNKEMKNLGKIK